jgi:hypothetical protein
MGCPPYQHSLGSTLVYNSTGILFPEWTHNWDRSAMHWVYNKCGCQRNANTYRRSGPMKIEHFFKFQSKIVELFPDTYRLFALGLFQEGPGDCYWLWVFGRKSNYLRGFSQILTFILTVVGTREGLGVTCGNLMRRTIRY